MYNPILLCACVSPCAYLVVEGPEAAALEALFQRTLHQRTTHTWHTADKETKTRHQKAYIWW